MNIANAITIFRILASLGLVVVRPFSDAFFLLYTLCGISDATDGYVARKTNTVSEFGSKLDSVADLLFYSIMILKILPSVHNSLNLTVWCFVAVVAVLKIGIYTFNWIKNHAFLSNHTVLNKITGFCVFLIPYLFYTTKIADKFCIFTCIVSIVATADEFFLCKR